MTWRWRCGRRASPTRAARRCGSRSRLGPKGIESLRDAAGRELPVLRLEPLLIGSIFPSHGEDRIVVTPAEVPPLLPAALKAIEDRKFDTHHGIDPLGMLRAAWVNVRAGQIEQGGSTLTQQLVRSYFLELAADVLAQAARGGHGDGARCALHQGRSHERLHQ